MATENTEGVRGRSNQRRRVTGTALGVYMALGDRMRFSPAFLGVPGVLGGNPDLHSRNENIFARTVRRYSAGGTVMVRVKTRAKWPWSW